MPPPRTLLLVGLAAQAAAQFDDFDLGKAVRGFPAACKTNFARFRTGTGQMWVNHKAANVVKRSVKKEGHLLSYGELQLIRHAGEDASKLLQASVLWLFAPELLPALMQNYRKVGDLAGARAFLSEMTEHYRGIAPVLALTRLMEEQEGVAPARAYLGRQLKDRPSVRGESALIDLTLAEGADSTATLHDLKHITDQLLVRNPAYRCTRCGFGARTHHWQCPSCKEWGTVKPLLNYAVL